MGEAIVDAWSIMDAKISNELHLISKFPVSNTIFFFYIYNKILYNKLYNKIILRIIQYTKWI